MVTEALVSNAFYCCIILWEREIRVRYRCSAPLTRISDWDRRSHPPAGKQSKLKCAHKDTNSSPAKCNFHYLGKGRRWRGEAGAVWVCGQHPDRALLCQVRLAGEVVCPKWSTAKWQSMIWNPVSCLLESGLSPHFAEFSLPLASVFEQQRSPSYL